MSSQIPEVKIGGATTPFQPYIAAMEYTESIDALNVFTLELAAPLTATIKSILDVVKPGAPFQFTLESTTFKGDIVRVSYNARKGAHNTITAVGLEPLHRLRHQRMAVMKDGVAIDKIVEEIVGKASLSPSNNQAVSSTAAQSVLLNDELLGLLKAYCEERNYALSSDGANITFAPRDRPKSGSMLELDWVKDVWSVNLHWDISEVVDAVKVTGRDYRKAGGVVEYESKSTDLKKISGGDTAIAVKAANLSAANVLICEHLERATTSDVTERAKGELQRHAERFLKGQIVCTGQPTARITQKVKLLNAEWPLPGPYLISSVTQAFRRGQPYSTVLEVFSDSYPSP